MLAARDTNGATDATEVTLNKCLSGVDNATFMFDSAGITCVVSMLIWLEGDVKSETAVERLELLCKQQPKFRARCVRGSFFRLGHWVDMSMPPSDEENTGTGPTPDAPHRKPWNEWHCSDHLETVNMFADAVDDEDECVDAEYERAAVEKLFSEFVSRPFDSHVPMWRVQMIRGLSGPRTALGVMMHHCMADGIGLTIALISLLSPNNNTVEAYAQQKNSAPPLLTYSKRSANASTLPPSADTPVSNGNTFTGSLATRLSTLTHAAKTHVTVTASILSRMLLGLLTLVSVFARLTFFKPQTLYPKRSQTVQRRIAWSEPMDMQDMQTIRAAYPNITLNDVMVACLERAYRAHLDSLALERAGKDAAAAESAVESEQSGSAAAPSAYRDRLGILIPKSMRHSGDMRFENVVGIEFLLLDSKPGQQSTKNIIERTHTRMLKVKRSLFGWTMFVMQRTLFAYVPGLLFKRLFRYYIGKAQSVLSNVAGSRKALYFGSEDTEQHRVLSWMLYPPMLTEDHMAFGVYSYNGQVHFTAMGDAPNESPNRIRAFTNNFTAAYKIMLTDAQEKLATKQQQDEMPTELLLP
ncbi:hypothetical protein THASP1DRAFT_29439 [Thamnocephalis sphaerospora]|uniref:Uncharacterized protein n=1 Tax=Thamnocephalis sphaerospora TaxID=78915 RepID=A0A4P9XS30_9FUNG|nr:hypothetical protein THASP1DRAFT_29439 [Thamnocephalis sphaerospora]|eukprot:RKP08772.1 hypothetical protein THASP1DRAFT_29439 [Thamnocephalis sphaerospora]